MKTTIAFLLLLAGAAQATPLPAANIANMVAQSEAVMSAGLCQVANDPTDYKAETIAVLLPPPVGLRKILRNDYNWIRSAGYAKNKRSGRFLMSERIEAACKADAESSRCLAARSFWSQQPNRDPGNGVVTK